MSAQHGKQRPLDGHELQSRGAAAAPQRFFALQGNIPVEVWNRLGTKLLPKLRSGGDLQTEVRFGVTVKPDSAANLMAELQALQDLGLRDHVRIQRS